MNRPTLLAGGIALGAIGMLLLSDQVSNLRAQIASLPGMSWAGTPEPGNNIPREKDQTHEEDEGIVKLTGEQIALAKIGIAEATARM